MAFEVDVLRGSLLGTLRSPGSFLLREGGGDAGLSVFGFFRVGGFRAGSGLGLGAYRVWDETLRAWLSMGSSGFLLGPFGG